MYIEVLEEEGECERGEEQLSVDLSLEEGEEQLSVDLSHGAIVLDVKRVLVGAGARALFYPTLMYNVMRNKIQSEFRWWDRVDEFILLGAVPFPTDVPHLKELGVCGVVTLNESYETLVPASLYHAHDIDNLVIPTRDYLFAPSYGDICQAVDFIHEKACSSKTTYVHCKAGRGRSTTIVLCYLVAHKEMTPEAAFEYVRSIRPRVLLASAQWQAVQDYYFHRVKKTRSNICVVDNLVEKTIGFPATHELAAFDDDSLVMVTESDLDGYDESHEYGVMGNVMLAELSFASQAAIARLSCLWLRCHGEKLKNSMSVGTDQLGSDVDIRVY
ncbi:phosphatidylglycerophosphate phosphatase PTPMT2-like [Cornus florida]|uniref:phosphatidylglycerophosphate phosphatase PTPMT2-like n=1 Tax=Cornus florida TaxID=4283 RepID=UPI00289ACD74|nr:phosphatidylglycerophosphate phosphatase PTPMT2-like [Cornus florida]